MTYATAFFRAFDIELLDYPWEAALTNALKWCDDLVIVVGKNSRDCTIQYIEDFALGVRERDRKRISVVARYINFADRWWQQDWWDVCENNVSEETDWFVWLDLDELVADPQEARNAIENPSVNLVRFPFVHLYGTPSRQATGFKLVFNTRAGRRSMGYRLVNREGGAACAAVFKSKEGIMMDAHADDNPNMVTLTAPILHYGWCRNAGALLKSQRRHYGWYGEPLPTSINFDLSDSNTIPYVGSHPTEIHLWLAAHESEWIALEKSHIN